MNNRYHQPIKHIYLLSFICLLVSCVPLSNKQHTVHTVGPQYPESQQPVAEQTPSIATAKLDVIIPVFDPGLPEQAEEYEVEGIWPELRRAEANRFAYKLKQAMDNTRSFGAVRVAPDKIASGDLYLLGTIKESDGVNVEFQLDVIDISGKQWFSRKFSHQVKESFYKGSRNDGKDSYEPVFKQAAAAVVKLLQARSREELDELKYIADLLFSASFHTAFAEHMSRNGNRFRLISKPSDDDPMLKRTVAIRVQEQLFVDSLQQEYTTFTEKMDDSYLKWQEANFIEGTLYRNARKQGLKKKLWSGLLIGLAIAAAAAAANTGNENAQSALSAAAGVGALAGAWMLSGVFKSKQEAELHTDVMNELGESLNMELEPHVLSFQDQTIELTGNIQEQFSQWRAFLKRIYDQEITPDTIL